MTTSFEGWLLKVNNYDYDYLCQVNKVNVRDIVFVRCVSVCVCVCGKWTDQSDQFKMVKATDFKYARFQG